MTSITTDGEDYVASVSMEDRDRFLDMSRTTQQRFLRGYHLGETGKRFSESLFNFCRTEALQFLAKQANVREQHAEGLYNMSQCDTMMSGDYFPLQIYTSTMPRACETIRWDTSFAMDVEEVSNLNPLDKGDFAGKELEDIRISNPTFYQQLVQHAFTTRYVQENILVCMCHTSFDASHLQLFLNKGFLVEKVTAILLNVWIQLLLILNNKWFLL